MALVVEGPIEVDTGAGPTVFFGVTESIALGAAEIRLCGSPPLPVGPTGQIGRSRRVIAVNAPVVELLNTGRVAVVGTRGLPWDVRAEGVGRWSRTLLDTRESRFLQIGYPVSFVRRNGTPPRS